MVHDASEPLRGALVGCGYVAGFHLDAWQRVEGARLVALCDRDTARLERAGEKFPEAKLYSDAAALFDDGPLDFVEICTRPDAHPALVAIAAEHGAHVLCQKPAALTRAEFCGMIAVCHRAGVRLMIHENWRFRPWYRTFRAVLDTGAIGQPIRIRIATRDTRALRPDGFRDQPYFAAMPQLILFEMGCHLIDTARFLMGEVVAVSASLGRFGTGHPGEDVATLSLRFATGALGLIDMSWCAPADVARPEWALNETIVEGTEGTLRLQADGSLQHLRLNGESEGIRVPLPADDQIYVDGYAATQRHFIDGLRLGDPHETDGADNLKTMDVVWAGYQSAEEGRTIVLNA
jgi:predicted dehydrogenase